MELTNLSDILINETNAVLTLTLSLILIWTQTLTLGQLIQETHQEMS